MAKRLTPSEFELAISKMPRSLTAENIAIARAVLVDGAKQKDFIKAPPVKEKARTTKVKKDDSGQAEKGRSAMAISNVISRVWASHLENGIAPEGWQRFEVCFPDDLVPVVKRMELDAKQRYEEERQK